MIQTLKAYIKEAFKSVFEVDLDVSEINIEITKKEFMGDFTFVLFPYLRQTRKGPEQSADLVGNFLVQNCSIVSKYNIVKGFLNLSLSNDAWLQFVNTFEPSSFKANNTHPQKVMVEYSSPNTNKPLHLGHVRNNLLGYSICQILERYGHEVIKVNLINDRGIHICKSMLAYQRYGNGETPESTGMKGDHFVGKYYVMFDQKNRIETEQLVAEGMPEEAASRQTPLMQEARSMLLKWEEKDPAIHTLWNQMNGWVYEGFDATYKRMGVSFDQIYKESETYVLGKDIVDRGLKQGVFYKEADGSVWIDLTEEGLDKKLVMRSDGTSVYMTQDIGTAQLKYDDFKCDTSMYVVGNEQDYHFKVLKSIAYKLKMPYAEGIIHLSYGMVELPEGKLKTREGKVVDADNLMDEMYATAQERTQEQGKTEGMAEGDLDRLYEILGLGALKYFLLKVDPTKRILFNPQESIDFHGNTGTFIQYTHARCQSIVESGPKVSKVELTYEPEETEMQLMRTFHQFEDKLEDAARNYSPSVIAQYLYDVSKAFNSFYSACPILRADNEDVVKFRVKLTATAAALLRECASMLGMVMPNKM